jgi:hypothetical protein
LKQKKMLILWGNEHFLPVSRSPAQAGLRLMGESDPTASQPPNPVCDWSVGPRNGEVKREFSAKQFPLCKWLGIKRLAFMGFFSGSRRSGCEKIGRGDTAESLSITT